MPGTHKTMALISYRLLPRWQREWWNPTEEGISEACLLPDTMGWEWTKEKFKKYRKLLPFEEKLIPHCPLLIYVFFSETLPETTAMKLSFPMLIRQILKLFFMR